MKTEKLLYVDSRIFIKYLQKSGWKLGYQKHNVYCQYISADDNNAIVVPLNKTSSDYLSVLENSLNQCSQIHGISLDHLFTILTSPPSDILSWRINNTYTKDGLIPLDSLDDILESIKTSLAATAKDILTPNKYHKMLLTPDIKQLLSSYALGQTERGSYILNLLCPLGNEQLEFFEDPLSRRINEKLILSIKNIQEDISNNNISKVEEEIEQNIYSVNFLDSIVDLNESTKNSGLEIIANWNMQLPKRQESFDTVVIKPSLIEHIVYIAEKLRPAEKVVDHVFYGKISSVRAAPEIESRETVTITMVTIDENERKINLTANLDSNFESIYTAFENGYQVKIKGKLFSTLKKKTLQECSFEILND